MVDSAVGSCGGRWLSAVGRPVGSANCGWVGRRCCSRACSTSESARPPRERPTLYPPYVFNVGTGVAGRLDSDVVHATRPAPTPSYPAAVSRPRGGERRVCQPHADKVDARRRGRVRSGARRGRGARRRSALRCGRGPSRPRPRGPSAARRSRASRAGAWWRRPPRRPRARTRPRWPSTAWSSR